MQGVGHQVGREALPKSLISGYTVGPGQMSEFSRLLASPLPTTDLPHVLGRTRDGHLRSRKWKAPAPRGHSRDCWEDGDPIGPGLEAQ